MEGNVTDIVINIIEHNPYHLGLKLYRTFSFSRASLTGLVARAIGPDSLDSAIAINLATNK
jgi:hypothetical protein